MRTMDYLSLAIVTLISASVTAKDCECQQHKAGASGTGSCSLTESSSKCSISYAASSSGSSLSGYHGSSSQSSTEQARSAAAKIVADARLPIEGSFQLLNQREPNQISLEEFRAVTVGAFAATGSPDALKSWIQDMRLAANWGRPSSQFEYLHSQFQRYGCIEFTELSTRTRFLLISRFSSENGNCRR